MKNQDLVKLRGWGAADSRFDHCIGLFSSVNECFKGKEECKNRIPCKYRGYVRTTYFVETYWDDDEKSCQGSSLKWCAYALTGKYNKDPHKNYKEVWDIQKEIDKVAKWNQVWESMKNLYEQQLRTGAQAAHLTIQRRNSGSGNTVLNEIIQTRGVVLIGHDGFHVTAAAPTSHGIFHYDNDVGCCWCPSQWTWMEWVKFCYSKCKGLKSPGGFVGKMPLIFFEVGNG